MKRILSIILAVAMAFALSACGKDDASESSASVAGDKLQQDNKPAGEVSGKEEDKDDSKEDKEEDKGEEEAEESQKPQTTEKPQANDKPQVNEKPQANDKPQVNEKPQANEKPSQQEKPVEENKNVSGSLLADFKANASSDPLTIAEKLIKNPVIKFMGGATAVEEGYLTGFGDAKIEGFKSGAMFAPMIGTIPFVGYVFELESADKAGAFISKLKASADLNWNICTTADEMVTSSVGNKVFFVMCPYTFEE